MCNRAWGWVMSSVLVWQLKQRRLLENIPVRIYCKILNFRFNKTGKNVWLSLNFNWWEERPWLPTGWWTGKDAYKNIDNMCFFAVFFRTFRRRFSLFSSKKMFLTYKISKNHLGSMKNVSNFQSSPMSRSASNIIFKTTTEKNYSVQNVLSLFQINGFFSSIFIASFS